jgi:AcrR family transcriptional regulator
MTPASRRYRQRTATERQAERRGRLLDAALDAFSTSGYLATSIEQLCTAAGISTRNFYEEFPNREAVLVALHDALNLRAFQAVIGALADVDPADSRERATAGVTAYFDVMTSDPRWARIALVEAVGVSAAVEAHRQEALARFALLIEGEFSRLVPGRDHSLTAVGLVGAINQLVATWPDQPAQDLIAKAVQFIVQMLNADT